jgi:hypothetical protein
MRKCFPAKKGDIAAELKAIKEWTDAEFKRLTAEFDKIKHWEDELKRDAEFIVTWEGEIVRNILGITLEKRC